MADRIENNLPAQSDAAYIRALDNSGNPIRISKADLAQVVAELMPVATAEKNGLACRLLNVQSFNASLNKTCVIK